jgi:hypothetical protein
MNLLCVTQRLQWSHLLDTINDCLVVHGGALLPPLVLHPSSKGNMGYVHQEVALLTGEVQVGVGVTPAWLVSTSIG